MKLLTWLIKNRFYKITLDSYCKLQYWPWSVEDAHISVGLEAAWGKMQEFRVQCSISPYLLWQNQKHLITMAVIGVFNFNKYI